MPRKCSPHNPQFFVEVAVKSERSGKFSDSLLVMPFHQLEHIQLSITYVVNIYFLNIRQQLIKHNSWRLKLFKKFHSKSCCNWQVNPRPARSCDVGGECLSCRYRKGAVLTVRCWFQGELNCGHTAAVLKGVWQMLVPRLYALSAVPGGCVTQPTCFNSETTLQISTKLGKR
jgi:hypothetical protein